jgi:pre-rRNA-processing protein TSR4
MEEDEMDESDGTSTDLGYLEKSETWRLRSEYFPSKVGGKPSWLNLSEIPNNSQVQCENCQKPCIFLCQIYAPIEHQDDCFHRTLFIFMCTSAECCKINSSSSFKILRCQLPRKNNFYSYDPPVESEDWKCEVNAEHFGKLCKVCNLRSTSHCGKCRCVYYCSKEHQVADWKAGHKSQCCSEGVR